jgi:hypothetical protein
MSKPGYLRLLGILYSSAIKFSFYELDCDSDLVTLVYNLQMKRTQEALREK